MGFSGRVVVVTGAASGIGAATAQAFARRGARVHLADLDAERGPAVADACQGRFHPVDVTQPDAMRALADAVYAEDGRVDVLVLNAGIGHAAPIEDTTLEQWRRVLDVNLYGVIHGIHAFIPHLLAQPTPAHVVCTASVLGLVGVPHMAPYCATKFAIVGMCESLASELEPRGIRFTALCPGLIQTRIAASAELHGSLPDTRGAIQRAYERHGVSPDVVARDVLRAVRTRRVIQPSPFGQVGVVWWLKRLCPSLVWRLSRWLARQLHSSHR